MDSLFELAAEAAFFEHLPLECDGMVSVASAVRARDGVAHQAMCGRLSVVGVGIIRVHCWIAFATGQILDLRARMWLGNDARVPHGLFLSNGHACYGPGRTFQSRLSEAVFTMLAGRSLASAPALVVTQAHSGPQSQSSGTDRRGRL